MRPIVFAHGLESAPWGTKSVALRVAGFDVEAPDGRGLGLAVRLVGIRAALARRPGAVLVGSSYGGLAAAVIGADAASGLGGLLLLAPALHHVEPPVEDPATLVIGAHLPTWIVHGLGDTIVPVAVSRALADRCPHIQLSTPDDVHDLRGSIPQIVALVRALAADDR